MYFVDKICLPWIIQITSDVLEFCLLESMKRDYAD